MNTEIKKILRNFIKKHIKRQHDLYIIWKTNENRKRESCFWCSVNNKTHLC